MMISGRLGGRLLSNDPAQQPFPAQTIASYAGDASARAIHKRHLDASSFKAEGAETSTSPATATNVKKTATTSSLTKSPRRSLSAAAATDTASFSCSSSSTSSTIRSSSLSSLSVLDSSPTTPGTATVPTPVKLLQFIFSRTVAGRHVLRETAAAQSSVGGPPKTFPKPSSVRTQAFQLNVVQAVRSRDLAQCRALLEQGSSFDACNLFGESLLHMACRKGDVDMVKFLINEAQVQVNVHDDFGRTPFHDALWTQTPNFAIMDVLLESISPLLLLMHDVRCHTPFHYARREHWNEWVVFLKDRSRLIGERLCAIQIKSGDSSNLETNEGLLAENANNNNETSSDES